MSKFLLIGPIIAMIALAGCVTNKTTTQKPHKAEKVCNTQNATLTDKGAFVCKNGITL
ncbi:putative lipoprotein (plasmid) [Brucella anthropi]|jgi:outer membrane lipoprotein SlyB|nr:putative lipoprotein [Brucella anthropi]